MNKPELESFLSAIADALEDRARQVEAQPDTTQFTMTPVMAKGQELCDARAAGIRDAIHAIKSAAAGRGLNVTTENAHDAPSA